MNQKEINDDLKSYIHERKKTTPFWKRAFGSNPRPKTVVQEEIKEELEEKAAVEQIPVEEKKDLEEMEHKIAEVDKVERDVEEEIEEEHEGVLKRFFKRLRSPKTVEEPDEEDVSDDTTEDHTNHELHEHTDHPETSETVYDDTPVSEEEMKTMLKNIHEWIIQLPPEKLQEFKRSDEFKLYTRVLRQHKLIR